MGSELTVGGDGLVGPVEGCAGGRCLLTGRRRGVRPATVRSRHNRGRLPSRRTGRDSGLPTVRAASAQPAEPPPTIITSYCMSSPSRLLSPGLPSVDERVPVTGWIEPQPSGASIRVPRVHQPGSRHQASTGRKGALWYHRVRKFACRNAAGGPLRCGFAC